MTETAEMGAHNQEREEVAATFRINSSHTQ